MKYYLFESNDDDSSCTEYDAFKQACAALDGYHSTNPNGPQFYPSMIGFHGAISSRYVVWHCTNPTWDDVILPRLEQSEYAKKDIEAWIEVDKLTRKYDEE